MRKLKTRTGSALVLLPLTWALAAVACSDERNFASQGAAGAPDSAGGEPGDSSGGGSAGEGPAPIGGSAPQGGAREAAGGAGGAGGDAVVPADCEPGVTRSCYEAAAQTLGVGPCRGGRSTCNAKGSWGPCDDQVVPITEVCADDVDNDCNGGVDDISDVDGDGWTVCEGDCCELAGTDCEAPALVNPGAIDARHVAAGGSVTFTDDDCSGKAGDSRVVCDQGLALDDIQGESAAAALDVCRGVTKDARSWGLVSAKYVRANGMPVGPGKQAGLEGTFGAEVVSQRGERMLLLSTGHARAPGQADACGSNSCKNGLTGQAPPSFPHQASGCPPVQSIYDDIAFELKVRAPSNATGFRFSYRYWAFAKPGQCDAYLDEFVALVSPAPVGSVNGNIAFDSMSRPISPRSGLFDVCTGCTLGAAPLQGTGFDTWSTTDGPGGGTSWLTSRAPVQGGDEVTVRFAVWDGGDQVLDSSVLIDDFEWLTESDVGVYTEPLATPKSQ